MAQASGPSARLRTLAHESTGTLEDRKSRFLAHLVPIDTFEARLSELRTEHRKANHHVTAFRRMQADDRIEEGAKDDGEPAGTSGMPCLKVLQGAGLVNAGVIVVRYFGGVKLGGGGLARAYSGAVADAIGNAELVPWQRMAALRVLADFATQSMLESRAGACGLSILDRSFRADGVVLTLHGAETATEAFLAVEGNAEAIRVLTGEE